jgi:hypothetical protein
VCAEGVVSGGYSGDHAEDGAEVDADVAAMDLPEKFAEVRP